MGQHQGLPFYTIGQRRGLGISTGRPVYVLDLDIRSNRLLVGEEKDLYQKQLLIGENNLIYLENIDEPIRVEAKIRYAHRAAPARLEKVQGDHERLQLTLNRSNGLLLPVNRRFTTGVIMFWGGTILAAADW